MGGGDQRIESEGGEPIGSEVEIDWGGWGGVGGLGDSAWGEEFFSPGDGWGAEGGSGDGGIGNGAFSEAGPTIWDGAWGSVVAFAWVDGGLFVVDRAADLFVKETFSGVMRDRFDGGIRGKKAKRKEKFGEWLAKGMDDSAIYGAMMIRPAAETF